MRSISQLKPPTCGAVQRTFASEGQTRDVSGGRIHNPEVSPGAVSGVGSWSSLASRLAIIAAVTVGSLIVLGNSINLVNVVELLSGIHLGWATAGLFAFILGHFLRCWRYRLIWGWKVNPGTLGITATHGFAVYMLPMRLGELVLPWLVRLKGYTTFRTAFGGLVVMRILDATLVLALGAILVYVDPGSLSPFWPDGARLSMSGLIPGIVLLALVATAGFVIYLLPGINSGCARLSLGGLTVGIWTSILSMNYAVVKALGLSGEPVVLVLLVVLGLVVTVVPAQGFASLGGHELVWSVSLIAGGIARDAALQVAVTSHVLVVGYVCALGLIGLGLILGSRHLANS